VRVIRRPAYPLRSGVKAVDGAAEVFVQAKRHAESMKGNRSLVEKTI